MMYKWIGAVCVFAACGGFGFSLTFSHKRKEKVLYQMCRSISVMECELRYRLTPLPDLCELAAEETDGILKRILRNFSHELRRRISPDAASCMYRVLENIRISDRDIRDVLMELGRSMGRFDLNGQLEGLDRVMELCTMQLAAVRAHKSERLRCYKTIGLCTGAALVIILV